MHSNSLIPLIYKPTRETKTTATLIDNIFTNNYNVNDLLLQGLLITDISDHYAIFHILDKPWLETDQYQLIRLVNDTRLAEYKETISTTDLSILDQYKSCEVYFTHFFNKMKSVHDKSFLSILDQYKSCEVYFTHFFNKMKSIHDKSFQVIKVKKRYRNRIPWLTHGLRESIKQKINSTGYHWNIRLLTMKHYINSIEIWSLNYSDLKKNNTINPKLKPIKKIFEKLGYQASHKSEEIIIWIR